MLYFELEVHPQRVVINEVKSLATYDYKARVDGQEWLYKIKKSKKHPPKDKYWFSRAETTLFWHAKNSGNYVTFVPVEHVKKRRKVKRHPNQIELF